jgi:hypothetical protein
MHIQAPLFKTLTPRQSAKARRNRIKDALRNPYTWPGGYEKRFSAYDAFICADCVKKNLMAVFRDTTQNAGGWNLTVDVYWEGPTHYCGECEAEIESAYGDPFEKDEESVDNSTDSSKV